MGFFVQIVGDVRFRNEGDRFGPREGSPFAVVEETGLAPHGEAIKPLLRLAGFPRLT